MRKAVHDYVFPHCLFLKTRSHYIAVGGLGLIVESASNLRQSSWSLVLLVYTPMSGPPALFSSCHMGKCLLKRTCFANGSKNFRPVIKCSNVKTFKNPTVGMRVPAGRRKSNSVSRNHGRRWRPLNLECLALEQWRLGMCSLLTGCTGDHVLSLQNEPHPLRVARCFQLVLMLVAT